MQPHTSTHTAYTYTSRQYVYIHSLVSMLPEWQVKVVSRGLCPVINLSISWKLSSQKVGRIGTCSPFMFLSDTLASWTVTTRAQRDCPRPRSYCVITLHGPCFRPHGAHMPQGDGHLLISYEIMVVVHRVLPSIPPVQHKWPLTNHLLLPHLPAPAHAC